MALCLAESLTARSGFDGADLLSRFVGWRRHAYNSVTGECFDIGVTTAQALRDFERTSKLVAGPEDRMAAGDADEAERLDDLQ